MSRILFAAVALVALGFALYVALDVAPVVAHATAHAFGGF